ncbi:MAG: HAMP domain-containing sensor histidine kinase, partial [Pseudomonadota bacterium]
VQRRPRCALRANSRKGRSGAEPPMIFQRLHPTRWPITVKAPVLAALFMVVTSGVISQQVLSRLAASQEKHLEELSGAYLDGLSSSILLHVLREDVWEVFDALERAGSGYAGLKLEETVVLDRGGRVLAANDPRAFPTGSLLPTPHGVAAETGRALIIDRENKQAHALRDLTYQTKSIGRVHARMDISTLLDERREVLIALILTNLLVTALLAAGGYLAVQRIVSPVRTLDLHLSRGGSGFVDAIADDAPGSSDREFGRLFRRYNEMAAAVNERQVLAERLAEEEKIASLGRLTSEIAHEINNPLAGMMNAIETLKRHGHRRDVFDTSLGLLERGLVGIHDVVRVSLETYRRAPRRPLAGADLDDLELLVRPKFRRSNAELVWHNRLQTDCMIDLPADDIRQIVLNLLLNACSASAQGGTVTFAVQMERAALQIHIEDEGRGLTEEYRRFLSGQDEPGAPLRKAGGLGLWLVRRLCDELGGRIEVRDVHPAGTKVIALFPVGQEKEHDVAA